MEQYPKIFVLRNPLDPFITITFEICEGYGFCSFNDGVHEKIPNCGYTRCFFAGHQYPLEYLRQEWKFLTQNTWEKV